MKKYLLILLVLTTRVYAYCTPDNNTCFSCGDDCVAELTYSKDESNHEVGTLTVYGTGDNGAGQMRGYFPTGEEPNRTTTAPWRDKLGDINNVVITEGVTNVGRYTFSGAKNITHLELPESVDTIEDYAFMDSTLDTVNTLKNVKSIGSGAFHRTNLTSVELSPEIETIKSFAFSLTDLESIVIPDSVLTVEGYAFYELPSTAKIYCRDTSERKCKDILDDVTKGSNKLVQYTQVGNSYFYDGKWYEKPNDLSANNYIKKRIYTVDEANFVSGKKK